MAYTPPKMPTMKHGGTVKRIGPQGNGPHGGIVTRSGPQAPRTFPLAAGGGRPMLSGPPINKNAAYLKQKPSTWGWNKTK